MGDNKQQDNAKGGVWMHKGLERYLSGETDAFKHVTVEAVQDYTNRIMNSLNPTPSADLPFICAALKLIRQNLMADMTRSDKELTKTISREMSAAAEMYKVDKNSTSTEEIKAMMDKAIGPDRVNFGELLSAAGMTPDKDGVYSRSKNVQEE